MDLSEITKLDNAGDAAERHDIVMQLASEAGDGKTTCLYMSSLNVSVCITTASPECMYSAVQAECLKVLLKLLPLSYAKSLKCVVSMRL